MKKMLKKISLNIARTILNLNRERSAWFLKKLLDITLGVNNDDMKSNGELFLLQRILKQLNNGQQFIAFDIGANVGLWTISLLDIASELGIMERVKIHCFEPSQFTFSKLQHNISQNKWGNRVTLINAGMGSKKGNKELYLIEEGAGTNSLYKRRLENLGISFNRTEIVKITIIDDYCIKNNITHVNFVKIDVEGHELEVMKGAMMMIAK